jgi:hypothetical protein
MLTVFQQTFIKKSAASKNAALTPIIGVKYKEVNLPCFQEESNLI